MHTFSLVIMAAGMGSRYGGLKQLETFSGATLLEYSIYDAMQAGFQHIVFVIQPAMEKAFRERIASKLPSSLRIDYAFQSATSPRTKPWGTGQAVLCARPYIQGPFGVVNADDYYGPGAFQALAGFFQEPALDGHGLSTDSPSPDGHGPQGLCLISYALGQTLSAQGGVSRAICTQDKEGYLIGLEEKKGLHRAETGLILDDQQAVFADATSVSLNCWGLRPAIWASLEKGFELFKAAKSTDLTAEYFLPQALTEWLQASPLRRIKVIPTLERWCGVTFKEDQPAVEAYIDYQYAKNRYPKPLFKRA